MGGDKRTFAWCGLFGLLLLAGGCAAGDAAGEKGQGVPKAYVAPANYRQVVAHHFLASIKTGKMLKAEISRPGEWPRLDGSRAIVCVNWRAQGPLIEQNYTLGFMFENGKVSETFNPDYINPGAGGALGAAILNASTCGKLTYDAFPEIMKAK